jgi:hypothetical protein
MILVNLENAGSLAINLSRWLCYWRATCKKRLSYAQVDKTLEEIFRLLTYHTDIVLKQKRENPKQLTNESMPSLREFTVQEMGKELSP